MKNEKRIESVRLFGEFDVECIISGVALVSNDTIDLIEKNLMNHYGNSIEKIKKDLLLIHHITEHKKYTIYIITNTLDIPRFRDENNSLYEFRYKIYRDGVGQYKEVELGFINIIKRTSKELGMTYRELGEAIGVSDGALQNASSTGKISKQLTRSLELILENNSMKQDFEIVNKFKQLLNK